MSYGVNGVVSVVSEVELDQASVLPIATNTLVPDAAMSSLKFSAFKVLNLEVTIAVIFISY